MSTRRWIKPVDVLLDMMMMFTLFVVIIINIKWFKINYVLLTIWISNTLYFYLRLVCTLYVWDRHGLWEFIFKYIINSYLR